MDENAQPALIDTPAAVEAGNEAGITQQIAATLPPVEPTKPESTASRVLGVFKRKRGRPRKNPFSEPENVAQIPVTVAPENPLVNVPLANLSPDLPADYSGYGKIGAAIVCGIYEVRKESLRKECESKLPRETVDRVIDGFSVPDNIRNDLEAGYTALAQEMDLPPVGGTVGAFIASHVNLELHFRASVRVLLTEIRKMPDLKVVPAAS